MIFTKNPKAGMEAWEGDAITQRFRKKGKFTFKKNEFKGFILSSKMKLIKLISFFQSLRVI